MEEDKFLFSNCVLFNGKLFFIECYTGLPTLMNLENGDLCYCDIIRGYIHKTGDIVDYIGGHHQKIYILEQTGKNLLILDLEKNECQYKEINCDRNPWGNFAAFEKYNMHYYIFPKYGDSIFSVDIENDKIKKLEKCFCGIDGSRCCCRVGQEVWILPEGKCVIGAFDLVRETVELYDLKEKIEDIVDAVQVNKNIFFMNLFGLIYKWDVNQKQMEIIETLKTESDEKNLVSKIIYAGDKLIVFPLVGDDIKMLDMLTGKIEIYQGYPSDFMYQEIRWSKYCGYCEDEFYYYFAMRSANYVLRVGKKCGDFIWIKPQFPTPEETQRVQRLYLKEKTRIEFIMGKKYFPEKEWKVTEFIKIDLESKGNEEGTLIGSQIYEEVSDLNES